MKKKQMLLHVKSAKLVFVDQVHLGSIRWLMPWKIQFLWKWSFHSKTLFLEIILIHGHFDFSEDFAVLQKIIQCKFYLSKSVLKNGTSAKILGSIAKNSFANCFLLNHHFIQVLPIFQIILMKLFFLTLLLIAVWLLIFNNFYIFLSFSKTGFIHFHSTRL